MLRDEFGFVKVVWAEVPPPFTSRNANPQAMIDQALSATDLAVDLLRSGVEPFGVASERWMKLASRG